MYTWTVDVEGDWGGRTNEYSGITQGLPVIISTFKQHGIKALFFVSTELTESHPELLRDIRLSCHEVGSHGHFHQRYKEVWRREKDRKLSLSYLPENAHYRAPWFSHETSDRYSQKEGHVSVLKRSWFKTPLPDKPIFYIHPFDIVGGKNAPSLFTRILYSRPNSVLDTFRHLVRLYPYSPEGEDS